MTYMRTHSQCSKTPTCPLVMPLPWRKSKRKSRRRCPRTSQEHKHVHKNNFDKRHLVPSYAIRTVVLLKNVKRKGRMGGKMEAHYSGPYKIMKELGLGVYCLKNLKTQKVMAKTCNSMRFKVYHRDTGTSNSTSPGDSHTELTSTEPITSKKTPPDDPTSPPKKRRIDINNNSSTLIAGDTTPQSGGQGPSTKWTRAQRQIHGHCFITSKAQIIQNQWPTFYSHHQLHELVWEYIHNSWEHPVHPPGRQTRLDRRSHDRKRTLYIWQPPTSHSQPDELRHLPSDPECIWRWRTGIYHNGSHSTERLGRLRTLCRVLPHCSLPWSKARRVQVPAATDVQTFHGVSGEWTTYPFPIHKKKRQRKPLVRHTLQ